VLRLLLILLSAVIVLPGCATITRGTNDTLQILSDPAGARADLSTGHTCMTPCAIKLPRKSNGVVKIYKEGYEPLEVTFTNQISGTGGAGMAGNVIFGGIIGAGVDVGTGAMYDLLPNPISVRLNRPGGI
jgi:hypothetical protein